MRSMLHSPDPGTYTSLKWLNSQSMPGVSFAIRRISLSQRIELTRAVRDLLHQHDFLRAGDAQDQVSAALAELTVSKLYIDWGLAEISGLQIDGHAATTQTLLEKGPEGLAQEIAESVRSELGLSEEERKNS